MISSENPRRVPVKNIFYMLVYAWNHPHEMNSISVFEEDEKDLMNLLSKVLIMKVKALIKRGFYKEYVDTQEESGIIRGKILFKESIQMFSNKRGKMHIRYEDMSYNILHNQLIKATLYYLTKHKGLIKEHQEDIRKILPYFEDVSLITVTPMLFNEISLHRNNQHYQFLLNICQFIWENSLLNEGVGEKDFNDFTREHQQMARLFENFVKNFYRKEVHGSKVKSESFYWPAEGEQIDLLPKMLTDISLEFSDQKFILDTKFYKDMLAEHRNKETIRSGHLYQLFAYLKNDEYYSRRKATGILLYPKVDKALDLKYKLHGFDVRLCTLDLTQHWSKIHSRLLEIIGFEYSVPR